jgi:hypothetical protein
MTRYNKLSNGFYAYFEDTRRLAFSGELFSQNSKSVSIIIKKDYFGKYSRFKENTIQEWPKELVITEMREFLHDKIRKK